MTSSTNHCSSQAAAVGHRVQPSAALTAPSLKDQSWTKSCARFLTQLAFWLWDQAGSTSERLQWQNCVAFPQCLSDTQRHSRFCRNQPLLFLSIIQYYWPALLVHHCEGPAARNKELRKSQRLNFIIHGFAHCLESIPIYKCSGKEGEVQERRRASSRDSRNNPHCKSSSDNKENLVHTKWMNGWMNKSLSERGTGTAHWCGLHFSPDAWGKEFSVPHWACAWDIHLVDNSLIIYYLKTSLLQVLSGSHNIAGIFVWVQLRKKHAGCNNICSYILVQERPLERSFWAVGRSSDDFCWAQISLCFFNAPFL